MNKYGASFLAGILTLMVYGMADANYWSLPIGGSSFDEAFSVRQTVDGGFIVAGRTNSFGVGDYDAWVLKLNADGSAAWQRTYGGSSYDDVANSVQQTADGGFIVAGGTDSFGAGGGDAWVLKLNADGSVDWQKAYGGSGGDTGYSVQQTADGGFIVAGKTDSFGAGSGDAWVLKLNADGSVDWQKTYGGSDDDYARSVQQTADGGYILAGGTESFGAGGYDGWVLKLSADGSVDWQQTYGGSDDDYAFSVRQTADGGFIAAGITYSFSTGDSDAVVLKLNADGSVAWQKTYGEFDNDYAFSVQQTADGGFIVAGETGSFGAGGYDVWVLKLNADGSLDWQKTYGGSNSEYAWSIQQTIEGGYIVAGGTGSFGTGSVDVWALRLDQNGGISGCSAVSIATSSTDASIPSGVETGSNATTAPSAGVVTTTGVSPSVTNAAVTANCSYTPPGSQYVLELFMYGKGTGMVSSSPAGLNCLTDCSGVFSSGSVVTLTATPDPLATFGGWSGACSAGGQVTMDSDKICFVTFDTPADFSGSPRYGYVPFSVDFNDLSTHGPTLWSWDFGDTGMAYVMNPSHVYREPGLYTVTLTATGAGGAATARRFDYVTAAPCANLPARIGGPAYYSSVEDAYGAISSSGSIDLQAIEFVEPVDFSTAKTVTLTGGYTCDYALRIGDSLIRGSLTIGGSSGPVTIDGITVY